MIRVAAAARSAAPVHAAASETAIRDGRRLKRRARAGEVRPTIVETGLVEYAWNVPTTGARRDMHRVPADRSAPRRVDVDDVVAAGAQLVAQPARRACGVPLTFETAPLARQPMVPPSGIT